jgi:hypothetical protein
MPSLSASASVSGCHDDGLVLFDGQARRSALLKTLNGVRSDTRHIKPHILVGLCRFKQSPTSFFAQRAGPFDHLRRSLDSLHCDNLPLTHRHRLTDIQPSDFLYHRPAERNIRPYRRRGLCLRHHPLMGQMFRTIHNRILQRNSARSEFLRNRIQHGIIAFVFSPKANVPNPDCPPVRQISQNAPRGINPSLRHTAYHNRLRYPATTHLSNPAARPCNCAVKKNIHLPGQSRVSAVRQPDANHPQPRTTRSFGNQKRQPPLACNQPQHRLVFTLLHRRQVFRLCVQVL